MAESRRADSAKSKLLLMTLENGYRGKEYLLGSVAVFHMLGAVLIYSKKNTILE